MRTLAVVPIKTFDIAKQRLAAASDTQLFVGTALFSTGLVGGLWFNPSMVFTGAAMGGIGGAASLILR